MGIVQRANNEFIPSRWSVFYNPFYFIRNSLYRSIKKYAAELDGDVLDFGCGAKPYRSLFTRARMYTGVDIEVSGHSHENEDIEYYYDGKTLPFRDGQFDHVFSTEVFEHVFNLEEIIPEISRVMKPGGLLLITCPFMWPEHEKPYDYARYTSFGIRHLLEKNGYRIRAQEKTGGFLVSMIQLQIMFIYYFLPKRPGIVYLLLHQIFILPQLLAISVLKRVLPRMFRRDEFYTNNVVLAEKMGPATGM